MGNSNNSVVPMDTSITQGYVTETGIGIGINFTSALLKEGCERMCSVLIGVKHVRPVRGVINVASGSSSIILKDQQTSFVIANPHNSGY